MISREEIVKITFAEGFNLCGITTCDEFTEQYNNFKQWLNDGYGSMLPYLSRNLELRRNPKLLMEGAQSIIVCAVNYRNTLSNGYPTQFDGAKVASYALTTDYHFTLKQMLQRILQRLQKLYPNITGRCFTDTAPLLEKSLAVRAGLGRIGRNSLLITPQYGSFVLLGEILINDTIDYYDAPLDWEPCGECHLCQKLCPVSAINNNRTIDPRRCISARTLESERGTLSTFGWVCGCDECQSRCPHNIGKPMADNPLFAPIFNPLSQESQLFLQSQTLPESLQKSPLARAFRKKPNQ